MMANGYVQNKKHNEADNMKKKCGLLTMELTFPWNIMKQQWMSYETRTLGRIWK
jgi:hypothetical protein